MKTRKQYINGSCTHREYFAQFVTDSTINYVLNVMGEERLLRHSENLSGIPLKEWDNMHLPINIKALKEAGDSYSLSVNVCIGKETARQIIEQLNK